MSGKLIKVTLVRSTAGRQPNHRKSVLALGLRKIGHTTQVVDTAATRGLIAHVGYLLRVEEV